MELTLRRRDGTWERNTSQDSKSLSFFRPVSKIRNVVLSILRIASLDRHVCKYKETVSNVTFCFVLAIIGIILQDVLDLKAEVICFHLIRPFKIYESHFKILVSVHLRPLSLLSIYSAWQVVCGGRYVLVSWNPSTILPISKWFLFLAHWKKYKQFHWLGKQDCKKYWSENIVCAGWDQFLAKRRRQTGVTPPQ